MAYVVCDQCGREQNDMACMDCFHSLEEQIKSLENQNDDLVNENTDLKNEIEKLKDKVIELSADNNS